jgi:hypothetical protein
MPKTSSVELPSRSPVASTVPPPVSRRRFGKGLVIAVATSLSSPSLAASGEAQGQDAAGGVQNAEVETKLANIVRKYGSRLSQEEREHLRKILAYNEKMLASVRAFSVQNGDSPASVFKVSVASPITSPK